jgi:DMSO reductase anchor subunit
MHPAFSVIFLTTLLGAGQGLFLALVTGQVYSRIHLIEAQSSDYYLVGSLIALTLLVIGLFASFFHLGRPERAWRTATKWRTSWLSREVIVLPLLMVLVATFGLIHWMGWTQPFVVAGEDALPVDASLLVGVLGALVAFALFVATAMIYASVKFLQEWATPLTVFNFTFFGLASGFMLAAAYSAFLGNDLVTFFGTWAVIFTAIAFLSRGASLLRNRHIKYRSNLKTAIGVRHQGIAQKSQGFSAGSFNTREFFHHRSPETLKLVRVAFMVLVFPLPVLLIGLAYVTKSPNLPILAFLIQYLGLVAERWYFFAEAQHPQNLYYQSVS